MSVQQKASDSVSPPLLTQRTLLIARLNFAVQSFANREVINRIECAKRQIVAQLVTYILTAENVVTNFSSKLLDTYNFMNSIKILRPVYLQ